MKTIDFYRSGDYLNCYGSDALLVSRSLGIVRLTVDERHATQKFPDGCSRPRCQDSGTDGRGAT